MSLQARISTRLQQYRVKSELARNTRPQAWVPREKLPRPLTSSASAIRKLMRKAELMGISTDIFPVDNSDTSSSVDGRRKHKQPALTADFVNYYLGKRSLCYSAAAWWAPSTRVIIIPTDGYSSKVRSLYKVDYKPD